MKAHRHPDRTYSITELTREEVGVLHELLSGAKEHAESQHILTRDQRSMMAMLTDLCKLLQAALTW